MRYFFTKKRNHRLNSGVFHPIIDEGPSFTDNATGGGFSNDGFRILDRDGDPYVAELGYDNGVIVDDTEHPNLVYWKYVNFTRKYHENNFAKITTHTLEKNPYLEKLNKKINDYGSKLRSLAENGFNIKELLEAVETFTPEQLEYIVDTMPSSWERAMIMDHKDKPKI